jgi:DNA-binding IclR family transcriptional regulator
MNAKRPPDRVPPHQTLARALRILEVFGAGQRQWGIRELGRKLDINPATVLRLVQTLEQAGYLERHPDTQLYALGPMVMKLASAYMHDNPLPAIGRKVFEAYADRFEYNFYLGVLRRFEVVYLAVLDGRGPLKVVVEPGATVALHTTALGKVLLAFSDASYIRHYIDEVGLLGYAPRSITDQGTLLAQLEEVRRTGIAFNVGEHYEDIAAVGAPIHDTLGRVVAGVSLAFPRYLLDEQRIQLEPISRLVQEVAAQITLRNGGIATSPLADDPRAPSLNPPR